MNILKVEKSLSSGAQNTDLCSKYLYCKCLHKAIFQHFQTEMCLREAKLNCRCMCAYIKTVLMNSVCQSTEQTRFTGEKEKRVEKKHKIKTRSALLKFHDTTGAKSSHRTSGMWNISVLKTFKLQSDQVICCFKNVNRNT